MSTFAPTREQSAEIDWKCMIDEVNDAEFTQSCPLMMSCFPNANMNGNLTCQCGAVVIPSLDSFPDCNEKSADSWKPMLVSALSVTLALYNVCWGLWIIYRLRLANEFMWNAVTKALVFCCVSAVSGFLHQFLEFVGMIIQNADFHRVYYNPGVGISQVGLAMLGFGMILCDLRIPLMWIGISWSGLASTKILMYRMEILVRVLSWIYFATFIGESMNRGAYSVQSESRSMKNHCLW